MQRAFILLFVLVMGGMGQETAAKRPSLDVTASWRGRAEAYDWFDSGAEKGQYTFGASTLRLGLGQARQRWDWMAEIEQPSLFNLPSDATQVAPKGALGLGANYFSANTEKNDAFLFLKQAFIRAKFTPHVNLRLGRFEFIDGAEVSPKDVTLATLKKERIAHRLIGNFAFSHVGRSYDGAELEWNRGSQHVSLMGARTTQGVFDLNGMPEIEVNVQYAAYTQAFGSKEMPAEFRAFAVGYEDTRSALKVDNRSAVARAADKGTVSLGTYGAHYLQSFKTASGDVDVLLWGALQNGSWGSLGHRAGAGTVELGYQPKDIKWKPWFRAGYFRSTGDENAADHTHGTFFQVLPTPRIYARFPFYNAMNSQDEFVQAQVQPTSQLTIASAVHWLQLANRADLWYSGGGAFDPNTFGYAGRPSGGHSGLANAFDLSATYKFTKQWSANAYFNYANGGAVVDSVYGRHANASFGYLELNWTLPKR